MPTYIPTCRKCHKNKATYYAKIENERPFIKWEDCYYCQSIHLKERNGCQPPIISRCDICKPKEKLWMEKSEDMFNSIKHKQFLHKTTPYTELFQFYACGDCLEPLDKKIFQYSASGFVRYCK